MTDTTSRIDADALAKIAFYWLERAWESSILEPKERTPIENYNAGDVAASYADLPANSHLEWVTSDGLLSLGVEFGLKIAAIVANAPLAFDVADQIDQVGSRLRDELARYKTDHEHAAAVTR